jgi:uncharacterized protein
MSRADIIAALREKAADIKGLGATSLYLLGSAARNEATEQSDVDLFVDYDAERFSFVELIRLRERLSAILGRPADLTRGRAFIRCFGRRSRPRLSRYSSDAALPASPIIRHSRKYRCRG